MNSERIKKIISGCLISLTLLGMGGVTISLINITFVLQSGQGDSLDKTTESKTYKNDKIYDNFVRIQVKCASVLAMDENKEYVPVSYATLDLDNDMSCTLRNGSAIYSAKIEDGMFLFSNIVPGEYVIEIDDNGMYEKHKWDVTVLGESQIEYMIDTRYQDESLYEPYSVAFERCPEEYYMFMDADGKNKIVDETFKTDSKGTFFFLVNWELAHDVHIHLLNGGHTNVKIDERFNGGTFIN